MKLTVKDFNIIGMYLEGFLYGLYSGIFAMYLQVHWISKKGTDKRKKTVFYALCALYSVSFVNVVLDIAYLTISNPRAILNISILEGTVSGCCDFIAQSILIYRCWVVWSYNTRVMILPSISAFVFLVIWVAGASSQYLLSGYIDEPGWGYWMFVAGVAMSITVNALVTGLIIFKIFIVYREIKSISASDDQTLGVTVGSKTRTVILILFESGMVLFSIQLARILSTVLPTEASTKAYQIIVGIHQMLNGITPTIILVRTSMGLSFYEREPMIESTVGTLRFAASNPNSVPEMGDVDIVNRDDERLSDDIQMGITPTIILVRTSIGLSFYEREPMIESTVGTLRFAASNPNSVPETGDVDIVNKDDEIGVRLSDDGIQMLPDLSTVSQFHDFLVSRPFRGVSMATSAGCDLYSETTIALH
ncbi:hypothetical protein BYT27DRAFT_7259438 [Phlegmacium glaucopus]|nr:hypothetical protein BYT27DRAFT_7259438 [Phlegmacium glaucopus]